MNAGLIIFGTILLGWVISLFISCGSLYVLRNYELSKVTHIGIEISCWVFIILLFIFSILFYHAVHEIYIGFMNAYNGYN